MPLGVRKYPELATPLTQAERLIIKFGGYKNLQALLRAVGKPLDLSTLYKWTYPKSKGGAGGVIPHTVWPLLYDAARLEGFLITPEDLDVRPKPIKLPPNNHVDRGELAVKVNKILRRRARYE